MNQAELSKIFDRIINKVVDKRLSEIKMPQKGVDYFTNDDINLIIATIIQMMPKPQDGVTPVKGKDYFTDKEVDKVTSKIKDSLYIKIKGDIIKELNGNEKQKNQN